VLVTIVSLVIPDFDVSIGSNTVILPLGAVIAPIAGAVATSIAGEFVPRLTDVAAIAGGNTNQTDRAYGDESP
jgi:hypothetical protein